MKLTVNKRGIKRGSLSEIIRSEGLTFLVSQVQRIDSEIICPRDRAALRQFNANSYAELQGDLQMC